MIASFCNFFSYTIFLALPPLRNSTTSFRAMLLVPAALFALVATTIIAYHSAFVVYSSPYP